MKSAGSSRSRRWCFTVNWNCKNWLALAATVALTVQPHGQPPANSLPIPTVSNRADRISGGDAFVEIPLGKTAPPDSTAVSLNGRDVRSAFHVDSGRQSLIGLVEGL